MRNIKHIFVFVIMKCKDMDSSAIVHRPMDAGSNKTYIQFNEKSHNCV
jgi:hypothetical protein